jgi:hypothetical protein
VRHPVRTRFGLLLSPLLSPSPACIRSAWASDLGPTLLTFLFGLVLAWCGGVLRLWDVGGSDSGLGWYTVGAPEVLGVNG